MQFLEFAPGYPTAIFESDQPADYQTDDKIEHLSASLGANGPATVFAVIRFRHAAPPVFASEWSASKPIPLFLIRHCTAFHH
jgi:hypothetical protein